MTWSWPALVALAAGSYALKALGLVLLGDRKLPTRAEEVLDLLPAALIGALVVVSTFGDGRSLVLDPRVAGLAAAAVAVWRRAGFVVVVVSAAAATALVRLVT